MPGLLIADAGTTKTDWSFLPKKEEARNVIRISSHGINPVHQTDSTIEKVITSVKEELKEETIDSIYFFGAGCLGERISKKMEKLLNDAWPLASINIESDIIGASKALFGDKSGLTCILGTGSNTCLYKNGKIIDHIPPLGFILGDEGSGASLGKRLLNAIYKRDISEFIIRAFEEEFQFSEKDIIERVYRCEKASSFLASFTPFLYKYKEREEITNLLYAEFKNFFDKNILNYGDVKDYELGFIGSVAWFFRPTLEAVSNSYGFKIHKILKAPILELEKYYKASE